MDPTTAVGAAGEPTIPDEEAPPPPADGRGVALVHHWLVRPRGGERVLRAVAAALPGADLYTLVHDARAVPAPTGVATVTTSPLQRLPLARRAHRWTAPLHARAWRALDLSGHDLVLSTDAALAKTVRVPDGARHVCLCFSPPRWAWDLSEVYLRAQVPAPLRPLARVALARVRHADADAARRVDAFLAISRHVAERIARCYGREALVVYPPVDTGFFCPAADERRAGTASAPGAGRILGGATPVPGDLPPSERPYLMLGEWVPYKRFESGVRACRALDRPLIVAGDGPRRRALERLAGPRTRFVRRPDDATVRALYRGCRALLFPGEEDLGLVPLEAMACGRPVVALGRGGATETVQDGVTGVLYAPPQADGPQSEAAALQAGLLRFEALEASLHPAAAVARARRFSPAAFRRTLLAALGRAPHAPADVRPASEAPAADHAPGRGASPETSAACDARFPPEAPRA